MKIIMGAVSLNTKPLTEIFLDTLKISIDNCVNKYDKLDEEIELKIVIVDNGSTDNVLELAPKYPWVTWIRNNSNLGVAPAWNQIIKEGYDDLSNQLFDYYIIANNDIYITKHWLENYIECLKQDSEKKYGWITSFMEDYQEVELTGVPETVQLLRSYWPLRPHADDVVSVNQMLDVLNRAYEPFGGIENFAQNLENKYGLGLREIHYKAPLFALSKECIKKVGIFDESGCPIGLHEDADYVYRIEKFSDFKFATAYGAYVHHFSMMTQTKKEMGLNWVGIREQNFRKKWNATQAGVVSMPKNVGIKLEIGSGGKPLLEDGWYHLDIDKNAPHVDFIHNILNPLPMDDNSVSEIFCCHNLEHIEWRKTQEVLTDWYKKLKPEGRINIRVPNFRYLVEEYLRGEWIMSFDSTSHKNSMHGIFGGENNLIGNCFSYHKAGFDFNNLSSILSKVGFENITDVSESGSWELRVQALKSKSVS